MTEQEIRTRHQKIRAGVKVAIAQAIERHRRLGESIAIWRDGKVVVLEASQIPIQTDNLYSKVPVGLETPPRLL